MVGVAAMLALHSEALSEVIFPLITSQTIFARGPERATVEQVSFLRSRALRLARFR